MAKYKCETCGYETEHNGAFNLHKYHCNLQKGVKTEKKPKEVTCEHSWRLLNSNDVREKLAIEKGFSEVCEKCLNIR